MQQDHLVGKYAYKKNGFFSDLIGIIEEGDGLLPYKIVFRSGSAVGFTSKNEIVLLDEDEVKQIISR